VRVFTAIIIGAAVLAGLIFIQRSRTMESMNSLFVIAPYKYEGLWVFDDLAAGLAKEPFIAGIDTMIDKAVVNIPHAARGFRAIFSAARFPGSQFKLEWRREEGGGDWY